MPTRSAPLATRERPTSSRPAPRSFDTCPADSGPARTCEPSSWVANTAGPRTRWTARCTHWSRPDLSARLNGSPVTATAIPQNSIGTVAYQVENVVLPAGVKIEVKGLATKLGIPLAGLAEADIPGRIVERLLALADEAGGDAPLPSAPSNEAVRDLQGLTGNELTQRIYERKDDLLAQTEAWTALASRKAPRLEAWGELQDLLRHADEGEEKAEILAQRDAIQRDRSLLDDPDPVGPMVTAARVDAPVPILGSPGRLRTGEERRARGRSGDGRVVDEARRAPTGGDPGGNSPRWPDTAWARDHRKAARGARRHEAAGLGRP